MFCAVLLVYFLYILCLGVRYSEVTYSSMLLDRFLFVSISSTFAKAHTSEGKCFRIMQSGSYLRNDILNFYTPARDTSVYITLE